MLAPIQVFETHLSSKQVNLKLNCVFYIETFSLCLCESCKEMKQSVLRKRNLYLQVILFSCFASKKNLRSISMNVFMFQLIQQTLLSPLSITISGAALTHIGVRKRHGRCFIVGSRGISTKKRCLLSVFRVGVGQRRGRGDFVLMFRRETGLDGRIRDRVDRRVQAGSLRYRQKRRR